MPKGVYTRRPRPVICLRPIIRVIGPSIAYIPLTQGKYSLIESDDIASLEGINWCALFSPANGNYYAGSSLPSRKWVYMHRVIMGQDGVQDVDHKNGDGLDNRKKGNLRWATIEQNRANSRIRLRNPYGFKGIHRVKNRFRAAIGFSGKFMHIGYFDSPQEAHAAYCAKAVELYGEFARFN